MQNVTRNERRRLLVLALAAAALTAAAPDAGAVTTMVGNRGNSMFYPENTTSSIAGTAGKADMVLINVRKSSDGALVVIHDDTLNRTTNGTGPVNAQTLAQLKTLDAGAKFDASFAGLEIPTLAEAVAAAQGAGLMPIVDRRSNDISASELADELTNLGVADSAVVLSEDWTFLSDLHTYASNIRLAAMVTGGAPLEATSVTLAAATGAEILVADKSLITSTNEADLVHAESMELFAANADGAAIQQMLDFGVDGIISNDPALINDVLGSNPYVPGGLDVGLVSYWRLDDALYNDSPSQARDSRGLNPGTLINNPTWTTAAPDAKFGGAMSFDAANQQAVLIPASQSLDLGTSAVTLSLWVKLGQLPSELSGTFGGIFDSVEDSYVIYLDKTNNELRAKVAAGTNHAARPGVPASALTKTEWHHVVAVYDGGWGPLAGETRIYFDGKLMDVHAGNDNSSPAKGMTGLVKPGQIAALGRNGSQATNFFTGKIDDVAVWNRALSNDEIRTIHEAGQNGQPLSTMVTVVTAARDWSLFE